MAASTSEPTWTARTENSLAQLLCNLAEGDELPGVCGVHVGEARLVLAHLAEIGALAPQGEQS